MAFELNAQQYNFVQYSISEGLPQTKVTSLFEDSNGYIWLTTENGGASRFDGKDFQNYSTKNGLLSNNIHSITECASTIYFHSEKGTNFLNGSLMDTFRTETCMNIIEPRPIPNFMKGKVINQTCQLSGRKKTWIGTLNNGLVIGDNNDSSMVKITEREGLPNNQITSILKDSWGNIWIGSHGGLIKYLGETFTHFDKNNGLHGNKIYGLEEDYNGHIWVATLSSDIAIYDGQYFSKITRSQDHLNLKTNVIYQTSDNEMWMGTQGEGLVIFDSTRFSITTIEDGLPSSWVNDITEDKEGNIWISTPASGLAKIERNDSTNFRIKEINKADGLPDNYISCLEKDNKGRIYFGTKYGKLGRISNDKVDQLYETKNGIATSPIQCILYNEHRIYVGSQYNGIFIVNLDGKDPKLTKLKLSSRLNSNTINSLAFDNLGYLWAGTDRGVNRLLIAGDSAIQIEQYGKREGFLGVETSLNSVLVDSKENLWFGTKNGLTRHKPSNRSIENLPPKIHFADISLFYKSLLQTEYEGFVLRNGSLKSGLELPYHKNHLSFDFAGLHQIYPEKMQYQWQLVGAEGEWSPVSRKAFVNYTNLPPGDYTFKVKALAENNLSSEPITASFTIKKPFWQFVWFQILTTLFLLFLMISFAYWRVMRFQRKEQAKRHQLEMENNMLQLEQKALQLQMNPHFIFNALNSIQSLVATKDYNSARTEISNFAILMRSILSNSKREKISLEEEIKTLHKYLELEQFCQPTPFDFSIKSNDIDLEETEIPPMLIQPFVENAIIHGISHLKERKGKLTINFNISNDLLECRIEDNGVGRKRSQALNQSKKSGHQSIAMEVTVERLNALKGSINYTAFKIEDLKDKDSNALGTKVVLQLPYESSF